MFNPILIENQVALEELSLKPLTSYFSGLTTKLASAVNNNKLTATLAVSEDLYKATHILNKRNRNVINSFTVITPEGVTNVNMLTYLTMLNEVTVKLTNIESRLLRPLEIWAGLMISDKNYRDKPWLVLDVSKVNVEAELAKLQLYFSNKGSDGMQEVKFTTAYGEIAALDKCGNILDQLTNMSSNLLGGRLSSYSTTVASLLNDVTNRVNMTELPEAKVKQIGNLVYHTAQEIELLAMVLFQIKVASNAHFETLKKIRTQLED